MNIGSSFNNPIYSNQTQPAFKAKLEASKPAMRLLRQRAYKCGLEDFNARFRELQKILNDVSRKIGGTVSIDKKAQDLVLSYKPGKYAPKVHTGNWEDKPVTVGVGDFRTPHTSYIDFLRKVADLEIGSLIKQGNGLADEDVVLHTKFGRLIDQGLPSNYYRSNLKPIKTK